MSKRVRWVKVEIADIGTFTATVWPSGSWDIQRNGSVWDGRYRRGGGTLKQAKAAALKAARKLEGGK